MRKHTSAQLLQTCRFDFIDRATVAVAALGVVIGWSDDTAERSCNTAGV